ncbi:hypothetical protein BvCmsH55A_02563 [Escherichia coli]|nr:hypothetical protein BvCmsH55A_02563 [Escherichia coli]GCJ51541.1 hypothetical protein BvCmsC61A_03298 [Escherichia coli]
MSILLLTISNDEFYRRWMEMKEEPDNGSGNLAGGAEW